jgi:cytochrome c peroxidase
VLNAALNILHWRGDRDSLEDRAAKVLTSPITPGQPDGKVVAEQLGRIAGYASFFTAAFPDEPKPIRVENIAKAISAFVRTLLTPSRFDAYLAGNIDALTPRERTGLAKFIGTGCIACHQGVGVGGGVLRKFGVVEDYSNVASMLPICRPRNS